MDSLDFIKSLTKGQREMLTQRSDAKGLVHLAGHLGLILLIGALIALEGPGWPILMLPQGILIVFLFPALHETSHRTAFRNVRLNKAVGALCGILTLLPAEWFRYFHIEHHRFTQDPARDPELQSTPISNLRQYLWHISGIPIWFSHAKTLLKNAIGRFDDPFVPAHARAALQREALGMLAVYVAAAGFSIAAGSTLLLYVWVIPSLLGQPFLRLFLLAEHGLCPSGPNIFESTRTTLTNRLVSRLAWNMPFHAEHHAFPAVPFHLLENFHMLARPHLRVTAPGYIAFHQDYIRRLRR